MGSAELQFVAIIIEILIKYGIPGVIKIISEWKKVGDDIHLKCRSCDHYAIISVINGEMVIIHVDKKGEEEISCCQK